jgi:hypothetical protein
MRPAWEKNKVVAPGTVLSDKGHAEGGCSHTIVREIVKIIK